MSKQKFDPLSRRSSSFATSREVWKYIKDSGITTVRTALAVCGDGDIDDCFVHSETDQRKLLHF